MRIAVETITPERARQILTDSEHVIQRAVSQKRVQRFAHAMREGQWMVTHQGIAFDPDGFLIDGQHRLWGVIASKRHVEMTVAYDVPRSTFVSIDTGSARTPADVVKMAGYGQANQLSAASRMLLGYDDVVGTASLVHTAINRVTTEDVIELLESPRGQLLIDTLPKAMQISTSMGKNGLRTWVTAALVVIRESGVSDELYVEFTDRLIDGVMLGSGSPLLAFRRTMMGESYGHLPQSSRTTYGIGLLVKTFNNWMQGSEVRLATYKPGVEIMQRAISKRLTDEEFSALQKPIILEEEERLDAGDLAAGQEA